MKLSLHSQHDDSVSGDVWRNHKVSKGDYTANVGRGPETVRGKKKKIHLTKGRMRDNMIFFKYLKRRKARCSIIIRVRNSG